MSLQIEKAVAVLKQGGVIAYPTEAVYGLGCDPDNEQAIKRLLELKQRDKSKGLILIASEFAQLQPYLDTLEKEKQHPVLASWPGPFTWLWPVQADVSEWLRGTHHSLAVRVTAHPLAQELCALFGGPVVSTSANLSNQPAARTHEEVEMVFGSKIDFILEGEVGPMTHPSEIRDARTGEVIRTA